jgi:Eukaryotic aspartyl protease
VFGDTGRITLGDSVMRSQVVIFDRANARIGFAPPG